MDTALPATTAPKGARRSRRPPSPVPAGQTRTLIQLLLAFVTLVLLLNALVGDRGLMETLRARRQHHELVATIERLRAEHARLQDEVRRLSSDPATIEALARQELGLIRPGEVLFIIRDTGPSSAAVR